MEENLIDKVKGLKCENNYATMSKESLIERCQSQDNIFKQLIDNIKLNNSAMLCKSDIMQMYHCESSKALKILKVMFNMGYGSKIGKQYYASKQSHDAFIKDMAGKEVFI